MPAIPKNKPYRVGRSKTGLGLFATKPIKKGSKIIRYFGPLLDSKKKKDDAIENKYLFELNNRWTIDGSVRKNVARYINHACKPNAESDVKPRKRKVIIRAIKNIEPGEEDQLRLRNRLFQGLPEADRLQMRVVREETQEAARRGAGRETPSQGESRAQGAERGRETCGGGEEGQGKTQAKAEAQAGAQRPVEGRQGKRQQPGPCRRQTPLDTEEASRRACASRNGYSGRCDRSGTGGSSGLGTEARVLSAGFVHRTRQQSVAKVQRRALDDRARGVDHDAKAPVFGEEGQAMPAEVRIDAAFGKTRDPARSHALLQQGQRQAESGGDNGRVI